MTKIVHLSSAHRATHTRLFYKMCKTLAELGYDVVLITPHDRDEEVESVHIRAVAPARSRRERMTRMAWQVYQMALREDAAVYHIHIAELLPYGQLLRLQGKKVVFDMYENTPKAILTKNWLPAYLRKTISVIYRIAERVFLRDIAVIFAESSYHKDYPWVSNYVEVLNMPRVDKLLSIATPKYSTPTLGYIGGVSAERGSLATIETIKLLCDRGYSVELELIGPAEQNHANELTQLIDVYQLPGVHLRGYMKLDEGARIIAKCHVGLAILKPIPNYVESFPTKMFEYMALGLPVIVSDFPLYRAVIDKVNCGLLVDPLNPQAIAAAVQWMLEHPEEATAMGERGREATRTEYNWTTEAQKLAGFYARLISQ